MNSSHSPRATRNMTNQMLSQLKFLEKNLEKKEKRLKRSHIWKKYRLPGVGFMIKRQEKGIVKVKADLDIITKRILKMQKDETIFVIISDSN